MAMHLKAPRRWGNFCVLDVASWQRTNASLPRAAPPHARQTRVKADDCDGTQGRVYPDFEESKPNEGIFPVREPGNFPDVDVVHNGAGEQGGAAGKLVSTM